MNEAPVAAPPPPNSGNAEKRVITRIVLLDFSKLSSDFGVMPSFSLHATPRVHAALTRLHPRQPRAPFPRCLGQMPPAPRMLLAVCRGQHHQKVRV